MRYLINGEEYNKECFYSALEAEVNDYVANSIDALIDDSYEPIELFGAEFYVSDIIANCDPTLYGCINEEEINFQLDEANGSLEADGKYIINEVVFEIDNENEEEKEN